MRWGYVVGDDVKTSSPLNLKIKSHCHALITGSSGSGKSYAVLYLLGCLLQDNPKMIIYFCDFKNSEDFRFLEKYPYYYRGNDCYDGVMNYYESFCNSRMSGKTDKQYVLIFDEYPAFINYLNTKDKTNKTKRAGDVLGSIAEILMLGRGIGYGVWIITQRADASLFSNGARDNFMIVLGLGRISREQKGMLFAGEELPEKVYRQGEGCLIADGHPLLEICIPKISNLVDWKKHIKEVLYQRSK